MRRWRPSPWVNSQLVHSEVQPHTCSMWHKSPKKSLKHCCAIGHDPLSNFFVRYSSRASTCLQALFGHPAHPLISKLCQHRPQIAKRHFRPQQQRRQRTAAAPSAHKSGTLQRHQHPSSRSSSYTWNRKPNSSRYLGKCASIGSR